MSTWHLFPSTLYKLCCHNIAIVVNIGSKKSKNESEWSMAFNMAIHQSNVTISFTIPNSTKSTENDHIPQTSKCLEHICLDHMCLDHMCLSHVSRSQHTQAPKQWLLDESSASLHIHKLLYMHGFSFFSNFFFIIFHNFPSFLYDFYMIFHVFGVFCRRTYLFCSFMRN